MNKLIIGIADKAAGLHTEARLFVDWALRSYWRVLLCRRSAEDQAYLLVRLS
jgi:hypothetical protein